MTYNIMARMSGGVQDGREAIYKTGGVVVEFDNKVEAARFAAELTKTMNKRHSVAGERELWRADRGGVQAVFEYEAIECGG